MIDKSLRKATAERYGDLIVIRMTGGGDCMWLNMYLDEATGQMTCDSDIGSFAYHWGRYVYRTKIWIDFVCEWLSNEERLLRKCVNEYHQELEFDREGSARALRYKFRKAYKDNPEAERVMADLKEVIDEACDCDDAEIWARAVSDAADRLNVELPDEWWNCIREEYTPWQKRFAEICREVIVPAIQAMEPGRRAI